MVCPYNNKSETQIQAWKQEFDEENESQTPKSGRTVTQTVWEPMECQRENCGAFFDGRCYYKD